MTFVKEHISEEDKKNINFDELTKSIGPRPRPSQWAVDRDANAFLISLFWGSADDRDRRAYLLGWNGYHIHFGGKESVTKSPEGLIYRFDISARPLLPHDIESKRQEIYSIFEGALKCNVPHHYARFEVNFV